MLKLSGSLMPMLLMELLPHLASLLAYLRSPKPKGYLLGYCPYTW